MEFTKHRREEREFQAKGAAYAKALEQEGVSIVRETEMRLLWLEAQLEVPCYLMKGTGEGPTQITYVSHSQKTVYSSGNGKSYNNLSSSVT